MSVCLPLFGSVFLGVPLLAGNSSAWGLSLQHQNEEVLTRDTDPEDQAAKVQIVQGSGGDFL